MILVDSSMWIDFLRASSSPDRRRLETVIADGGEVAVTEPVIMELLTGVRTAREQAIVEALTGRMPVLAFDPAQDFRAAAELSRASRANGHPIRSMVDCMIAAVAIRRGVPLLQNDRDYAYLAEISRLQLA